MLAGGGTIWFAGCGNMGGAMLTRWLASGLDPARVTVIRPSGRAVADGVRVTTAPPAGEVPALLVLACKPQKLAEAAPVFAPFVGNETILLSVLAGVDTPTLARRFPDAGAIVRAIPNTAVAIGKGVTALHAAPGTGEAVRSAVAILSGALGLVEWIKDEALFDAVTALAGSTTGFLFRFIDATAAAGAALGIEREAAARMALAAIEGAALLAAASAETPADLARRVASPGGSTQAGYDVLDRAGGLADLLEETLLAATRRNAEMGAAAR